MKTILDLIDQSIAAAEFDEPIPFTVERHYEYWTITIGVTRVMSRGNLEQALIEAYRLFLKAVK